MATQQEPSASRSNVFYRASWIVLTVLFLAAIVLDAFFSETGILQLWRLEKEFKKLRQEITDIERENAELEKAIEDLKSDPEAIEKVAREQLGFVKPGEDTYLFPKPSPEEKGGTSEGR